MSDTEPTQLMQDAIAEAIDQNLASKGGGLRLAYIYAIDVIDADGNSVRYLGSPSGQELYRSVGLNGYLAKYLDMEVQDEIAASNGDCSCCNGEDD